MQHQLLTEKIIGCAMEVHTNLGPGLLESIYEAALMHEFRERNILFENQKIVEVIYKGVPIGQYRLDFVVENKVIVEIKAVNRLEPVFSAQLLTYMKITGITVGLLNNFNELSLRNGIKRLMN